MCYVVYLSTDSEEDLSLRQSDRFRLIRASPEDRVEVGSAVKYKNVWYLESRHGGCSCHYRHLLWESTSLGFGEPEDWFPEDVDDVASTHAVYEVIDELVNQGHPVDAIDFWNGDKTDDLENLSVRLTEVPRNAFRFFEGYRFEFSR